MNRLEFLDPFQVCSKLEQKVKTIPPLKPTSPTNLCQSGTFVAICEPTLIVIFNKSPQFSCDSPFHASLPPSLLPSLPLFLLQNPWQPLIFLYNLRSFAFSRMSYDQNHIVYNLSYWLLLLVNEHAFSWLERSFLFSVEQYSIV